MCCCKGWAVVNHGGTGGVLWVRERCSRVQLLGGWVAVGRRVLWVRGGVSVVRRHAVLHLHGQCQPQLPAGEENNRRTKNPRNGDN